MMTRVVVAASIDNELESGDISAIQRLIKAGYEVLFYYYLPKVPAEYTMIPSFNEKLISWRAHANKMLRVLGNKLAVPPENRHLVDEILGPDQVIEEAKGFHVDTVLTHNTAKLKQTILSRFYDWLAGIFQRKHMIKLSIEAVSNYMKKTGQFEGSAELAIKMKTKDQPQDIKRKAA